MAQELVWVRLKPYNERKGFRVRRYHVFGIRFEEARGWYKVPVTMIYDGQERDVAEYLRQVRNDHQDPDSPAAFDVCSPAEAAAINAAEERVKASREKAGIRNPVDLSAAPRAQRSTATAAQAPEEFPETDDLASQPEAAAPVAPAAPRRRGRPPRSSQTGQP